MPGKKRYTVSLDPSRVEELMKTLDKENSDSLLQSMFDFVYSHYVEQPDELIPKKVHKKIIKEKTAELERKIFECKEKLKVKRELDKEKVLCPECEKWLKYDSIDEEYVCTKCGWRGNRNFAIIQD